MNGFSAEVRGFLCAGTRTAKLAFTAADGRPLVAPVWFVVEGPDDAPQLLFNTGRDTAKGRAIRRDPRLAQCIDSERPPYGFVQVQGMATWTEDTDELIRSATAIGARYMGPERAEEFGRRNAVPGELLVRLRPTRVLAKMDITG